MFINRLRKSRFFRWFAVFIAVLTAVLSLAGCTSDEIAGALSVLDSVLSNSGDSVSGEPSAPTESANAPPETSAASQTEAEPSSISQSSSSTAGKPAPASSSSEPQIPKSSSLSSSVAELSQSTGSVPPEESIDEDGWYSARDDVALYLHTFGRLPGNFLTKKEASALGWDSRKGNLWEVAEGMSIGGDAFGNREGLLPSAKGRKWYECDINYQGGYRGAERILFSSDGLIYYTDDHYQTYTQLY